MSRSAAAVKEAREPRQPRQLVNLCGACGQEISASELLCKECRGTMGRGEPPEGEYAPAYLIRPINR